MYDLCIVHSPRRERATGKGVLCHSSSDTGPCGIPKALWNDNGAELIHGCVGASPGESVKCLPGIPSTESDYFYQYGPLHGDGKCTNGETFKDGKCGTISADGLVGYFGYKTLGVSYGGTLVLKGHKGASYGAGIDEKHLSSGGSWLRLAESLAAEKTTLQLEQSPGAACGGQSGADCGWHPGDKIVVTTTDYLPGHSEELTIDTIEKEKVTFHPPTKWSHNGTRFRIKERLENAGARARLEAGGMDPKLIDNGAETRAAVALLTRSIRIVSAGDVAGETFEDAGKKEANCKNGAKVPYCYSFGAQTAFRQGFAKIQIQGVEFENLGQAGRLGHYPIHFHMARKTPADTYVKDSSVNESMTRWFVIHSTLGVTLARNVGYKSIGHGYYLEDGTETDNKFYSNLGIYARAAVDDNRDNPRKIPGILAADGKFAANPDGDRVEIPPESFPYRSDYDHPSVFWITNGWNDFIGNMAAGAGTCGAAYWFVPAWNSDRPDVPTADNVEFKYHMKWTGFAQLQKDIQLSMSTPLKSFYGNYATSTMTSFQTVGNTTACSGVVGWTDPSANANDRLAAIKSFAPAPEPFVYSKDGKTFLPDTDRYYPHVDQGGGRLATKCPLVEGQYDCSRFTVQADVPRCNSDSGNPAANPLDFCAVTVLDHFTSSFHWGEKNFAAIRLRPQMYLVDNSVLTDVQNSGITFVTSGDYSRSAVINGDWALARASAFVGTTQPNNPLASNAGPFNGTPGSLKCVGNPQEYCLSKEESISMPITGFGVNQRLFSIYDGPSYEDSNAYFDIVKTNCGTEGDAGKGACSMYSPVAGMRKDDKGNCYLPNAAIGWKQPNGFYYPPAFHSTNLFFDNVDIRHYVIDALFKPNTYLTNPDQLSIDYCNPGNDEAKKKFFTAFTDIDRQTELNDDDGSLTGLTNDAKTGTISVNPAEYFTAPVETAECLSNLGVTPDKACPVKKTTATPTAKTSPYDYVTTVVYPECAVGPGDANGRCESDKSDKVDPIDRFSQQVARAGVWSKECSNESCYGVPLYRQFLTADEYARWGTLGCDKDQSPEKCRWPFVRMGGQATYQRSTLAVNHGTFFLDTSVSRDTQWKNERFTSVVPCQVNNVDHCHPRSVNVFQKDQTYYLFFVFAKEATKQTYQIYVGPGFDIKSVTAVRAVLNIFPIQSFDSVDWPKAWQANYDDQTACKNTSKPTGGCGILQVVVDFKDEADYKPIPANGLCLPSSFCKADGTQCGCALADSDPLVLANPGIKKSCAQVCSTWAVKDLDYPPKGPLGFSFKMPSGFTADDMGQKYRPKPQPYPTEAGTDSKPNWATKFSRTATSPDDTKGVCHYDKLPPDCK
jgi:cell migration-inducing and hyaluronan-binding protein